MELEDVLRFEELYINSSKRAAQETSMLWFVNKETPSDVNYTHQWNNHMWYYCCEKPGGKFNGKWRHHQPSKYEGLAFIPEHRRKNTTADTKKGKRLKLTEAMQTLMEQVNHEDTDEDSQE